MLAWAAARGRQVGPAVALYAVLIAATERLARTPLVDGSDVLRATAESIEVTLRGGNPYAHQLVSTIPPGSPFVYPPGELLWYLPWHVWLDDITRVDTVSGIAIAALIGFAGLRVGFGATALPAMLYASWGILSFRAVDGSNDVSGSLLVVIALVALAFARGGRRRDVAFVISAIALGWAVAFKQFALLVVPPLLRHLAVAGAPWRRYAAISAGTAAAMSLPFFLASPGDFVGSQLAALTFHSDVWGANLAATFQQFAFIDPYLGWFFVAEIAVTLAAVALSLRARIPTIGGAALVGAGLITVPLLLARWTTQPYWVYVAAIALTGLALMNSKAEASAA